MIRDCAYCKAPTKRTINVFGPIGCCSDRCEYALNSLIDGSSTEEVDEWFKSGRPAKYPYLDPWWKKLWSRMVKIYAPRKND